MLCSGSIKTGPAVHYNVCVFGGLYNFIILFNIYAPRIDRSGAYCFCPVCLSICLSVINFRIGHNFSPSLYTNLIFSTHMYLEGATHLFYHLACEGHMSRSKDVLLIKFHNFNIGHTFLLSTHTKLIFGTHMYLQEPHILAPCFSRSVSHVLMKIIQLSII